MRDDQSIMKRLLEQLVLEEWNNDTIALRDTDRSRRLRPEIIRQLLSLVLTDDERGASLGFGQGCRVRESAKVISPESLTCGDHVWVGENAIVDASGGLEIGSHVTIGTGVFVWTHTSVLSSLLGENHSGNRWIRRAKTRIGRHSFIGGPSVINPGVSIGEGCLILPMSVVTSDVPDNTMVGGAPASFKRKIDADWLQRERDKF
jgi:acetyltransferase-like isoleucine patch superfamily enzyme